jgi:hypothetical protein
MCASNFASSLCGLAVTFITSERCAACLRMDGLQLRVLSERAPSTRVGAAVRGLARGSLFGQVYGKCC